jgi:hypothetical protein
MSVEMKPRLQEHYEQTVRAKLKNEFGYSNDHQIPRLSGSERHRGIRNCWTRWWRR